MAVSKRLRYEILRRDNHACRYCGAAAPDAKLTVDHVVPVALGGTDDPANLVTACSDCNGGKSASSPDAPTVANVAEDALRWSRAMAAAAERMLADRNRRAERLDEFLAGWNRWGAGEGDNRRTVALPAGWQDSVDRFLALGLPMPVLLDCIDIAMGREKVKPAEKFRYLCGIAWSKLTELQQKARGIANGQDVGETVIDQDTQSRYEFALELLGALGSADREYYLEWTSDYEDDGEPFTVEEQTIAAIEAAVTDLRTDLHMIEAEAVALLRVLPDGVGEAAMRKARTSIYDRKGTNFRGPDFVFHALTFAQQEVQLRDAIAYLERHTQEARDELARYATSLHGDLTDENQTIYAARVGRVLDNPAMGYPSMCTARGEHIRNCPERADYLAHFTGRPCCAPGPETCGGHGVCARHLEMTVNGEYQTRFPLADFTAITHEEEA